MIQDNPNMNELEEMFRFYQKFDQVYIYGHDEQQKLIGKYMVLSDIPFSGYLLPEVRDVDLINEPFPVLNVQDDVIPKRHKKRNIGVIIAVEDTRVSQAVFILQKAGFFNFYFVSEWNKRTIPYKMTPRSKENFWLEVNLADHCNLNCQCCDHFSPLAKETFLDYEQYVRDINRLAELTNHHIGIMKLQGGEPLLNNRVIDYMRVTREVFPETLICLFTDGLLLQKWGEDKKARFWENVKELKIEIRVTTYPLNLNFDKVIDTIKGFNIPVYTTPPPFDNSEARVWFFSEIGALEYSGVKHSVKHPFDLGGGRKHTDL